jgi:hypothetical protein
MLVKFHANCDTLSLLNAKSIPNSADKSVCQVIELEKIPEDGGILRTTRCSRAIRNRERSIRILCPSSPVSTSSTPIVTRFLCSTLSPFPIVPIRVSARSSSSRRSMSRELPVSFQRMAGYCEQLDVHEPYATVREALEFSDSTICLTLSKHIKKCCLSRTRGAHKGA